MSLFNHPAVLHWRARLVPDELDMGWAPFLSLGYLGFLALPSLLPRIVPAGWVPATLLTVVAFLPLYFRAYHASGREHTLILLAMWTLGLALAPYNPFANTLVIFACAFAPMVGSVRASALFALFLVSSYSAYSVWFDRAAALNSGITFLVGTACFIGAYYFRENQRKQVALRLSHDEVRRLAALAERERIGRDLHDLLGHTLSLIALKAELATRLWERDAQAARQEVCDVERVAREALAQVRRAVTGIRSAGVAAELASARLMLESSGVTFHYELDRPSLTPEIETALALVIREAVVNIQRHARASRAVVRIDQDSALVNVEISDDGRGGDIVPGNGLSGMRERLDGIGASLRIDSVAGKGTRLLVRVPNAGMETNAPLAQAQ